MGNMAVMGDYDSIFGFAAVGMKVYPITKGEEALTLLKHLQKQQTEVVFITEQLAKELGEGLKDAREKSDIAVILIPGLNGNSGEGIANIKKMVERAVGSDILFS